MVKFFYTFITLDIKIYRSPNAAKIACLIIMFQQCWYLISVNVRKDIINCYG